MFPPIILLADAFALLTSAFAFRRIRQAFRVQWTYRRLLSISFWLLVLRRLAGARIPGNRARAYRQSYYGRWGRAAYKANNSLIKDFVGWIVLLWFCGLISSVALIHGLDIHLLDQIGLTGVSLRLKELTSIDWFSPAKLVSLLVFVYTSVILAKTLIDVKNYSETKRSFESATIEWEKAQLNDPAYLKYSKDANGITRGDSPRGLDSQPRGESPLLEEENASVDTLIKIHLERGETIALKGEGLFKAMRTELEEKFPGQYVLINVEDKSYVIGRSLTEAHKRFKEKFGKAPGWGTRIAAAVFADAH
jgi:hypothetical protein